MLALRVVLLFIVVHTTALFPPAVLFRYVILELMGRNVFHLVAAIFLLTLDLLLLLLMATVCSGIASQILKLRYSGGHSLDLRNHEVQKWLLSLCIYLPTAVVLNLFHLYPLKSLHIKLFGGKIGRGVVMGGFVTDPAFLEVGDYSVLGGFSYIYGHAVEHGTVRFGKVTIGKNCGVGTRATVLAGAVMEDGSMLGAQSLLPKNARIPAGKIYGGVPARELVSSGERKEKK